MKASDKDNGVNGKVSYKWYNKKSTAYQFFDIITDSGIIFLKKPLTEKGRNFESKQLNFLF